jgi:hypothetical protein
VKSRPEAVGFVVTQLAIACALFALLWPALRSGDVPAFRDALVFYFPTWSWQIEQWEAGEWFPQWNPLIGTGCSMIGEPSSMTFYPLRAIQFLPALSVGQKLGWFLLIHLLLAATLTGLGVRWLGGGWLGATLASLVACLAMPLVFQIYNPIFLVGTAWGPLAICAGLKLLGLGRTDKPFSRRRSSHYWLAAMLLAGLLALICLGGDIQAAVNLVIVLLCVIAFQFGSDLLARERTSIPPLVKSTVTRVGLLVLSCSIATGIAACQLLPTLYWASESNRMLATTDANYAFSNAPWHLASLLNPIGFGSYIGGHRRWSALFVDEPRMWVPSLYVGIVPVLLIGCAIFRTGSSSYRRIFRVQSRPRATEPDRTLSWSLVLICVVALVSSFGEFGLGWVGETILRWMGSDSQSSTAWNSEAGGLYWLWSQLIPGYASFRYPAKWLVLFAGGLAIWIGYSGCAPLTASNRISPGQQYSSCETDTLLHASSSGLVLLVIAQALLVGFVGGLWLETDGWNPDWLALENIPADYWLGPYQPRQAIGLMTASLIWSLLTTLLVWILIRVCKTSKTTLSAALLSILFVDLVLVAHSQIDFVAADAFVERKPLSDSTNVRIVSNQGSDLTRQWNERAGRFELLTGKPDWDAQYTILPNAMQLYRELTNSDRRELREQVGQRIGNRYRGRLFPTENKTDEDAVGQAFNLRWSASNHLQFAVDATGIAIVPVLPVGGWYAETTQASGLRAHAGEHESPRTTDPSLDISQSHVILSQIVIQSPASIEMHYETPGLRLGYGLTLGTVLLITLGSLTGLCVAISNGRRRST